MLTAPAPHPAVAAAPGAYGPRLAALFPVAHCASIAMRTPRGALLAVTELRSGSGLTEVSVALPREPAAIVIFDVLQASLSVLDLRLGPWLSLPQRCHCLSFYMSRQALTEFGQPPEGALRSTHGAVDPWVESLAHALLPALSNPQEADRLFVVQVLYALTAHVAHRYGGSRLSTVHPRVRLAPWQERLAKELMQSRLTGVSVAELARECKLSPSHFARAFRHCTGLSPHRWLLACRVERAKELILRSQATLLEIALCCGFSDQSHFSRVFVQLTGVTPATWRRGRAARYRARDRRDRKLQ
jgi:AraC family transcriptional regulator